MGNIQLMNPNRSADLLHDRRVADQKGTLQRAIHHVCRDQSRMRQDNTAAAFQLLKTKLKEVSRG